MRSAQRLPRLNPNGRRVAFAVHVCASVGWLGAVAAFGGLAVVALTSDDGTLVRGAYLTMNATAAFVLVPFALLSLLSGLVLSLGTAWGLFRHYWVVFKLAINVFASAILVAYTRTLAELADTARTLNTSELGELRTASPLVHTVAALALLLVAVVLAVFKPRALTPLGVRASRRA